ncbi:MAG: type I polyketide synthase, partial [Gammaproteobacteria bacterium]|nr:type I polyketide synthase [Gammaproteobacteria bacterium]
MTQSGECERDPAEAAGSAGEQPEDASGESIVAIVGLACRFPGAPDADTYWRNLCDGVESIGFFSDAELERAGVARRLLDDPSYVRAGGCLPDIETFDAEFFGINPREAEVMDPQHRLFLECAWEALENAGCDSERYDGRIGVLGGVGVNGYAMTNLLGRGALAGRVGALQASIRNRTDHLTTHVCYKLDLRGPGITVQTACSTSLVAVHLACQSLLNGECDMALAGGASLAIPHRTGYLYQEGGILSPDGHCRAFDAEAAGTVPGSGAGIVVLKRYEDAIADGDTVVALIRGSAVNNDGSNKVGYTAPGLDGQVEVIAEALGVANVDAQTIGYVEAHGTGTHLGDPIEIEALTRAFGAGADGKKFCAIGSVKSNIGHLDTAAGVAGLIKAALALEHGRIPPSLHYSRPNPQIDFDAGPFYVNAELSDWARAGTPRRAGVSSFGIGGTNAHVVLESAPAPRASSPGRPWQLLTLSAKSAAALEAATQNLAEHLKRPRGVGLADVAYTLQVGRRAFEYRRAVVCREDDAARTLETLDPARVYTATTQPNARPVTFMFPGQGAQHVDMARELYETEAAFREELDRCCALLEPELGLDLRQILHPAAAEGGHAAEQLQMTALTQPALFAIEYALARLWIEWGVRPESMIGHSIGEYVAACLAGVLPLPDALRVIAARGRLMQDLPPGGMTIVPMAEHDVEPLLTEELSIAAVNGPAACVVAGPFDALERLEKRLAAEDHVCRRLRTSHAFHSSMMEPMLADFARVLGTVRLAPPRIPYLSNVTGTWIEE